MANGLRTEPTGGVAAPPYTHGPYTWTLSTSTASAKMLNFQFTNSATSGDNRAIYNRLYLTGAGTGGESLRSFTTVSNVRAGTVHGAHISLNWGDTGSASGLAVALRATLHLANQAYTGLAGTYSVIQAEMWADGATTDPVGLTELSFIRVALGGTQAGIDDIETDAFFMSLQGFTAASGDIFDSTINTTGAQIDHTLKIKVGTSTMYIPLMDNADGS